MTGTNDNKTPELTGTPEVPEETVAVPTTEPKVNPYPAQLVTLTSAVSTFMAADDIGDGADVAAAYRAIHAARQGAAQATVLKEAITGPNVDRFAVLIDVLASAGTSGTAATRRKQDEVPESVKLAEVLIALDRLISAGSAVHGATWDEATELAANVLNGTLKADSDSVARTERIVAKVTEAIESAQKGRNAHTGPKRTYKDSMADLVTNGTIKAGTVLTSRFGSHTAKVNAKGEIVVNGTSYTTPNAAAVKGCNLASAVNGWDFWTVPGTGDQAGKKVAVGTLRTA